MKKRHLGLRRNISGTDRCSRCKYKALAMVSGVPVEVLLDKFREQIRQIHALERMEVEGAPQ